jgi:starch-binding outer membrane protein, SusD/RagB family
MKKIFIIIFSAFVLSACESYVTGISEQDPTLVTDASLQQVYIAMEVEFAGTMEGTAARLAGVWSGYFTGLDRQYIDIANYNVTAGTFDDPWGNMFVFTMVQVRDVQAKAAALGNTNALGAAQVLEAYMMGTAAALWGDIPYRNAWKGLDNANPAFDPQTQVFDDVITLLDNAITNLTPNAGNFPGELLGGTTNAKWIRIANSLKARYLLYKKNYAAAAAAAALGVTTSADHLRILHGSSNGVDRNIYYDFMIRQRAGYMGGNTFLRNMMTNRANAKTSDLARRDVYYSSTSPFAPRTTSGGYFATDASFPLVTSWETNLIRAEAEALAGNSISNAALAALNAHRAVLRAAYTTGTYTDYVIADFDATTGIENNGSNGAIVTPLQAFVREVREEKYIALYGMIEVFNEIRRTNNPFGLTPVGGVSSLPQRFLYSQNEINSNTSAPNPIPGISDKTLIFQ